MTCNRKRWLSISFQREHSHAFRMFYFSHSGVTTSADDDVASTTKDRVEEKRFHLALSQHWLLQAAAVQQDVLLPFHIFLFLQTAGLKLPKNLSHRPLESQCVAEVLYSTTLRCWTPLKLAASFFFFRGEPLLSNTFCHLTAILEWEGLKRFPRGISNRTTWLAT